MLRKQRQELLLGEIGDFIEEMFIVVGPEGKFSMIRVTRGWRRKRRRRGRRGKEKNNHAPGRIHSKGSGLIDVDGHLCFSFWPLKKKLTR